MEEWEDVSHPPLSPDQLDQLASMDPARRFQLGHAMQRVANVLLSTTSILSSTSSGPEPYEPFVPDQSPMCPDSPHDGGGFTETGDFRVDDQPDERADLAVLAAEAAATVATCQDLVCQAMSKVRELRTAHSQAADAVTSEHEELERARTRAEALSHNLEVLLMELDGLHSEEASLQHRLAIATAASMAGKQAEEAPIRAGAMEVNSDEDAAVDLVCTQARLAHVSSLLEQRRRDADTLRAQLDESATQDAFHSARLAKSQQQEARLEQELQLASELLVAEQHRAQRAMAAAVAAAEASVRAMEGGCKEAVGSTDAEAELHRRLHCAAREAELWRSVVEQMQRMQDVVVVRIEASHSPSPIHAADGAAVYSYSPGDEGHTNQPTYASRMLAASRRFEEQASKRLQAISPEWLSTSRASSIGAAAGAALIGGGVGMMALGPIAGTALATGAAALAVRKGEEAVLQVFKKDAEAHACTPVVEDSLAECEAAEKENAEGLACGHDECHDESLDSSSLSLSDSTLQRHLEAVGPMPMYSTCSQSSIYEPFVPRQTSEPDLGARDEPATHSANPVPFDESGCRLEEVLQSQSFGFDAPTMTSIGKEIVYKNNWFYVEEAFPSSNANADDEAANENASAPGLKWEAHTTKSAPTHTSDTCDLNSNAFWGETPSAFGERANTVLNGYVQFDTERGGNGAAGEGATCKEATADKATGEEAAPAEPTTDEPTGEEATGEEAAMDEPTGDEHRAEGLGVEKGSTKNGELKQVCVHGAEKVEVLKVDDLHVQFNSEYGTRPDDKLRLQLRGLSLEHGKVHVDIAWLC